MSDTEDERGRRKLAIIVVVIAVVLVAWFLSIHHDIDVEVEGEGTVDPTDESVRHLGSAEFRIVPAEGWIISSVEVDGESADIKDGVLRLERVVSDHTVQVVFVEDQGTHELSIVSNEGGTTDPEGAVSFRDGEKVTVRIIPDDGYVVDDILLDNVSMGSSNRVDIIMDSNHTLQVVFREAVDDPGAGGHADPWVFIDVDVRVETTGADYGYVEPCGRVRVAYGGSLTVEIYLNEGYSIKQITADGMPIAVSNVFTVTDIVDPIEIGIVLLHSAEPRHSVTASASAGGSISPSGTIVVRDGDSIEFVLRADRGYSILRLTVDGTAVPTVGGRYMLADITEDHAVHAEFSRDPPVAPSLSSITLAGTPSFCYVDETLDASMMTVTAHYTDGSSVMVTGYVLSETSWTTPGTKAVVVSYNGRSASFEVVVPTLEAISVSKDPTRTVYGIGDSFDPAEMETDAKYSEGSQYTRAVVTTFSPASFGSAGNVAVILSYTEGSKTVQTSITVKVVDKDGFQVIITSYSGERMVDGAARTFIEYPNDRLSDFEFHLSNVVPGMIQTATLEMKNTSGMDLQPIVKVGNLTGSDEFAKQVSISCGGVNSTVFGANRNTLLNVGVIPSGQTVSLVVTIGFMECADNNSVLGHSLKFSLTVFADVA